MSESNDTAAIDEKNQESTPKSYLSNVGSFVVNVLVIFLIIIVYFSSSGLVLYACKLAQSNILPTEDHCWPYKETKPNIQPITINIFNTIFTDPPLSSKIQFPYDNYNSSEKIIDMFRNYKNQPRSNFLANYFISIIESIVKFNYSSFDFILNLLNELPAILLILFGPILVSIILTFILLLDHLYLIYLWFAGMGWFFKTNTNDSGVGLPKWEDVTIIDWIGYWCAVLLVILFVILFFFSLPVISVVAFLSISWCVISCIMYKSEFNGKNITSFTIIQDLLKYYKVLVMSIFSFFVVVSAFSKLGTIPGVFSIITLILIYWGIISIDIFKPINEDKMSGLTSYKQAKKTCSLNNQQKKEKHGILYDALFGDQQGGKIIKELKKLGKKQYHK